jgi:hypothetical protein
VALCGKGANAFMTARFIVLTGTGLLQAKPQHLSLTALSREVMANYKKGGPKAAQSRSVSCSVLA